MIKPSQAWINDCIRWRGKVLNGPDAHWCYDWDDLPVDAFTPEYDCCVCYKKTLLGKLCNWFYMLWFNWRMPR